MPLLQILAGILTGKAGEQIGGTVARAAELAAVLAALAPVVLWLQAHGNEVFVQLTYNQLALAGVVVGPLLLIVLRLVHRAPPP